MRISYFYIIDANRGGRNPEHYSPTWENGFDVCFSTKSKADSTAGDIGNRTPGIHFGTYYWGGPGNKMMVQSEL
jgi:hypothetical protein